MSKKKRDGFKSDGFNAIDLAHEEGRLGAGRSLRGLGDASVVQERRKEVHGTRPASMMVMMMMMMMLVISGARSCLYC